MSRRHEYGGCSHSILGEGGESLIRLLERKELDVGADREGSGNPRIRLAQCVEVAS